MPNDVQEAAGTQCSGAVTENPEPAENRTLGTVQSSEASSQQQ
jgi:hypothetical protein